MKNNVRQSEAGGMSIRHTQISYISECLCIPCLLQRRHQFWIFSQQRLHSIKFSIFLIKPLGGRLNYSGKKEVELTRRDDGKYLVRIFEMTIDLFVLFLVTTIIKEVFHEVEPHVYYR